MKIGILTFSAVANFGANLQAVSTFYYLKNHGHDPIVIDWMPIDFQSAVNKCSENIQGAAHIKYIRSLLNFSKLCTTSIEVAEEIDKLVLDGVIIGSDAVLQHHPFLERFKFPTKKIFFYAHYESTQIYPNAFWGDFIPLLKRRIPVAVMSGSSQSSKYRYICGQTKNKMNLSIHEFCYFSVRDTWTQDMIKYLSYDKIIPPITPDPVFAFNQNCHSLVPDFGLLRKKHNLPKKYVLVSFRNKRLLNRLGHSWFQQLQELYKADDVELVYLPMPMGYITDIPNIKKIELPLLPNEWYSLIKHAQAYIGENMHPIVVSLSNSVPVFCFDDYTAYKFYDLIPIRNSSKIEHIMTVFHHPYNRCDVGNKIKTYPTAEFVYNKVKHFNKQQCEHQARLYLNQYNEMMNCILESFKK